MSIYNAGGGGGSSKNVWYGIGTHTESGGVYGVTVTTTSGDFTLEEGNIVHVIMNEAKTSDNMALNLDVDNTGNKIVTWGGPIIAGKLTWAQSTIITFVYLGTGFAITQWFPATTTRYGVVKLSSSTSSTSENVAATSFAVKTAYDLADSKAAVQIVRW